MKARDLFIHAVLIAAVIFALYPILWVVALAFSDVVTPQASALPAPTHPSFAHCAAVLGRGRLAGTCDRNTFHNGPGIGTALSEFDNLRYATNLFRWLAGRSPS